MTVFALTTAETDQIDNGRNGLKTKEMEKKKLFFDEKKKKKNYSL